MIKNNKQILHLCPDDKFIDLAVKQFDSFAPGLNEYVIYNRKRAEDVKYIKKLDRFTFSPVDSETYKKVLQNCREGKYAAVIMHSLPNRPWEIVNAMRGNGIVVALTWGHEIYGFINGQDYKPKTFKLLENNFKKRKMLLLREKFLSLRLSISANTPFVIEKYLKAFLLVDYISPVIDEDYNLFAAKFNKHPLPKMLPFSYYFDFETIKSTCIQAIDDEHILVGNSATPTCNHLDIFEKLNQLRILNTIFVPLSYGNEDYGELIKEQGKKLFGERFISLDTFLTFEEYLLRLNHCRFVVMGHLRQQAVGNIILTLWMGAKVFFYKCNPVYKFLIRQGATVFCLEEATSQDFSVGLDRKSINNNKVVIQNIWGYESIRNKTINFITTLYQETLTHK